MRALDHSTAFLLAGHLLLLNSSPALARLPDGYTPTMLETAELAILGLLVVIASLVAIQFLLYAGSYVAKWLNKVFLIDQRDQGLVTAKTPKLAPKPAATRNAPPKPVAANDESDSDLVAVLTAASAVALGTQNIRVTGYEAVTDDFELIAVLTAAATVALDAPVQIVGVTAASDFPAFQSWIQYGRTQQFLASKTF